MKMQKVESSNLSKVGYDEKIQQLRIEFKRGGTYQYSPIPLPLYRAMMVAPSMGSFFNEYIKDNKQYNTIKI